MGKGHVKKAKGNTTVPSVQKNVKTAVVEPVKVGDRVFAQGKGHLPWPAKVLLQLPGESERFLVQFYGTYDSERLPADKLYPYNKDTLKKYGSANPFRGPKLFRTAMMEVEANMVGHPKPLDSRQRRARENDEDTAGVNQDEKMDDVDSEEEDQHVEEGKSNDDDTEEATASVQKSKPKKRRRRRGQNYFRKGKRPKAVEPSLPSTVNLNEPKVEQEDSTEDEDEEELSESEQMDRKMEQVENEEEQVKKSPKPKMGKGGRRKKQQPKKIESWEMTAETDEDDDDEKPEIGQPATSPVPTFKSSGKRPRHNSKTKVVSARRQLRVR